MLKKETISRDPDATQLATRMLEEREVMRTIVEETLESAAEGDIREAGRTKCPENGSIRGPLDRFPRAIDLAPCPLEVGGTWHTHVTPREIRNPVNSLPDMANVIYGLTNVSIVVGTETADVFVSPKDREEGEKQFENIIGYEAGGTEGVTEAIAEGRINPSPARERVRDKMGILSFSAPTGFEDLEREIESIPAHNWAAPFGSGRDEVFTGNRGGMTAFGPQAFDNGAQELDSLINRSEIGSIAVSTAIGTLIGGAIDRVVFGD